ncbi:MAG: AAA family ATPase [Kiritimatiellae bacterium]|nr:AAA family ATPase [Kiritimatiellia bacterium]
MAVEIWIGSEYDNTHENAMAGEAIATLSKAYAELEEKCHILVNFRIPGDPPNHPGEKPYMSEIDLAVLKPKNLIIIDLKNYRGAIEYGDSCHWICHASDKDVPIHGGREGRTPFGQLCDYRRQMIALLAPNRSLFLNLKKHSHPFDFRRFVSGMVLFPDFAGIDDTPHFETDCTRWFSVKRMSGLAEAVCGQCGGRDAELDPFEMSKFITDVLKLAPAHMVGGVPKVGAAPQPKPVQTEVKIVTVERPVKIRVEVPKIVRDEFGAILIVCDSDDPNAKKIADMGDIFRRLVARERKRKFKETQVRSLGTAAELLLKDDADLTRCAIRLFRLSAAVHNSKNLVVSKADVEETLKTLCRVAEKFCGEPMPDILREHCDAIVYRESTGLPRPAQEPLKAFFLEVKSVDAEQGVFTGISLADEARMELVVKLPDFALEVGMVVCALTPKRDGDVWEASEIVLEPDYLLSPKSIGGASVYARPELHFWLNAIQDDPDDKYRKPGSDDITMDGHILLGNFANACLAERCARGGKTERDLVGDFCRENAVEFTDANPDRTWFEQCKQEEANISHVLNDTLPGEHGIQNRDWQIEAPIYSPQYGLSARADALSYAPDRSSAVIFELKSGKWDCFRGNTPRKEHICQPTFYGDILGFRSGLRRESVFPYLYYAKTIQANDYAPERKGQLFLRPNVRNLSPGQLIRYFVSIRNSIMMIDRLARSGELRNVVDSLCTDDFRNPAWDVTGKLWREFKEPELVALLSPFQSASDLAKRYFYRMFQFVAEESFVTRIGDAGAEIGRGGISMLWRLPVAKRQETGMRLSELVRLPQEGDEDALHRIVRLTFDTTRNSYNSGCSIRQGDGVGLYADEPDSNLTNSVVFGASVEKIAPGRITLKLDNPQPVALFNFDKTPSFAVESAPMSGMRDYKALWHFLTGDEHRQSLVLNTQCPEVDRAATLPIPLDRMEQRYSGVSSWLGEAWRAKDWYLLWGPPGTGKTSCAMRALVDEAMASVPRKRILLLAYTYKATDKICEMLEKRIQKGGETYLRIGNVQKCDPQYRSRIPEEMNLANREAVRKTLDQTRIFVSTVSTLGPKHAICGLVQHFDLAIVDEASQLLDTHVLPLFCAHRQDGLPGPLVDKFILIGDDKQLPAVVQQNGKTSRIEDEELKRLGFRDCRESFFARLKRIAGGNPELCGLLDTQFRMHPMIADFCNEFFYEGRLKNGNAPWQTAGLPPIPEDAKPFSRYVIGSRFGFFPIAGKWEMGGKTSETEAKTCVNIIRVLRAGEFRPVRRKNPDDPNSERINRYKLEDFGIIVPFRNQIACMREYISDILGAEADEKIVVDTVERYQGGERPVIIFSTVITSAEQADWISAKRYGDEEDETVPIDRKLNVAITRAQERFYLVGCERVLNNLRCYGELLRWISDHAGFCEAEADDD